MYAMINRDKMVFASKHPSYQALCNLAWIQCASAHIFPLEDAHKLREFTDMELGMLYSNTVGKSHENLSRPQLQQVLFDLILCIPDTVLNTLEVEAQADKVQEAMSGKMRYVQGSYTPAKQEQDSVFKLSGAHDEESETKARAGHLPALARLSKPIVVHVTEQDDQRPSRPAGAARGTNKPIIWKIADRVWEEAGAPTDVKTVLELRKAIMNELEKEGVKRASASSELGNWMKTKPVS